MSKWRTKTRNRIPAGLGLALLLLAALPVCAASPGGIVTPKGAKSGAQADAEGKSGAVMQKNDAESSGAVVQTDSAENSASAAQTDAPERSGSPMQAPAGTGTAVLVGAGAYTYMRIRWKEKEKEKEKETATGEEIVYFENHTKTGTLRENERTDF